MSTSPIKDRVGLVADRPVIPNRGIGARYLATDEEIEYEWNGVAWRVIDDQTGDVQTGDASIVLAGDIAILTGDAAPTDGTEGTGAGVAGPGSLHTNSDDTVLRINTGTKASPVWESVGGQT